MKRFGELFKKVEAKKPIEAVVEPPKASSPTTVTMTKKQKLNVLGTPSDPTLAKIKRLNDGKLPRSCRSCAMGSQCPKYDIEAVCAYLPILKGHDTRDKEGLSAIMHSVVENTQERYNFAVMAEQVINGGMPLPETTRLAKDLLEQTNMLLALDQEEASLSITGEGDDFLSNLRSAFSAPASDPSLDINPPAQLPNPVRDPVIIEAMDGSQLILEPNG